MERVNWNQAVRPSTHDLIASINSGADDIERIDGALDVLETILDGKADASGTYPDFVAGEALAIRSGIRSNTFLSRALDSDIADGIAEVERVLGNTVVWNQLVQGMDTSTNDGITTSYDSTTNLFSITNNSRTTNYSSGSQRNSVASGIVSGHKYLIGGNPITGVTVAGSSAGNATPIGGILTASNNSNLALRITNAYDFATVHPIGDTTTFHLYIVDLTQMFGAGNEPQTVAEFEAQYPTDYYAYSAPTLLSSNIAGIEGASSCEFPAQTLRGIGTALDVMTRAGIERKIGVVDLGDLTWTKSGEQFYTTLSDVQSGNNVDAKCAKYENNRSIGRWQDLQNGQFAIRSKTLRIYDSNYENAAAFKAGNTGVKLQFILATPTTETFAEPLDLTYRVAADGSEAWIVPDGTQPTSAAVTGEIGYPLDPARALITNESFADFCDKLGAYLGATITETWDGSKYTYSFASSRSALLGSIEAEPDTLEVTEKDDMVKEIIEDERKEL